MAENVVMHASSASTSPSDLHELRVRISNDLHRQLLSLKVLRGRSLAESVSLALDMYFDEVRTTQEARSTRVEVQEVSPAT
jgi:hypothetical protein